MPWSEENTTRIARSVGVELRRWRRGDLTLLRDAEHTFSTRSLTQRFRTGCNHLPPAYLKALSRAGENEWIVVAAVVDGRLVGIAECAGAPDQPELGLLIADEWQRRGIALPLVRALLRHCAERGITVVNAEADTGNAAVASIARSLEAAEDGFPRWHVDRETLPGATHRYTLALEETS